MHLTARTLLLSRTLAAVLLLGGALLVVDRPMLGAIPEPEEPKFDVRGPINEMKNGTRNVVIPGDDAATKKNRAILSRMAKFLAWRIARPPFNGDQGLKKDGKSDPEKETMQYLMDEADRYFQFTGVATGMPLNPRHIEYANEFGKAMETELLYVLDEAKKPIEKVNAVRMMSLAAKLPYPGFADSFLKIIRNPRYPDGLKVYAFQGLRNTLAHSDPANPGAHIIADPKKLAEIALELEKIITTQYPIPKKDSDEYIRVIQFIRRYAIQALAQFKNAVIRTRQKEILARPCDALLRVATARSTGLTPLPSNLERFDAVNGLCRMKPDESMDLSVYTWLVNEAIMDILGGQAIEKDEVAKTGGRPRSPWKVVGATLAEALGIWKKTSATLPARMQGKIVSDYVDQVLPVFQKLETDGIKANPEPRAFTQWRNNRNPLANENRVPTIMDVYKMEKKDL